MGRTVATWQENGMLYTLTASPINTETSSTETKHSSNMISVYQYLGNRTPEYGTGAKIYNHAKSVGAKYEAEELNTPYYQGKIMLYEREFLDSYFNTNSTTTAPSEEDDDLPF
jgi:hypothetical protein